MSFEAIKIIKAACNMNTTHGSKKWRIFYFLQFAVIVDIRNDSQMHVHLCRVRCEVVVAVFVVEKFIKIMSPPTKANR